MDTKQIVADARQAFEEQLTKHLRHLPRKCETKAVAIAAFNNAITEMVMLLEEVGQ